MWQQILPALRIKILMTILVGIVYPLAMTGLCQLFFPYRANGSLITDRGRPIGSELIGQRFTRAEYFQGRPSAAGNDGYDASNSNAFNYGPTSRKLYDRVKAASDNFRKENPGYEGPLPADLVTASASGLDPHISPASALAQAARVAAARGVSKDVVEKLIKNFAEGPDLGILGEPRVNVLRLNLALDKQFPRRG